MSEDIITALIDCRYGGRSQKGEEKVKRGKLGRISDEGQGKYFLVLICQDSAIGLGKVTSLGIRLHIYKNGNQNISSICPLMLLRKNEHDSS